MAEYRIALAGATGAVGRELLELLQTRNFPCGKLRLLASARSAGRSVEALGRRVTVEDLAAADPGEVDVAFFCAGAERSRAFAPAFARAGAWVIDNSSAFRKDPDVPLIVPEINGSLLEATESLLIANPNCSTIIALLPLAALHRAFGLERVLVSTYQAVSGAGGAALEELVQQERATLDEGEVKPEVLPRVIHRNLIPWIGTLDESGFCEEERKMTFESRKILGLPGLRISATTVRVPVRRSHSMAIWVQLREATRIEDVNGVLAEAEGVELRDDPPCPLDAERSGQVLVGRIRRDPGDERAYWLWAVSDQLWKGAALNALQIAEQLHSMGRIPA